MHYVFTVFFLISCFIFLLHFPDFLLSFPPALPCLCLYAQCVPRSGMAQPMWRLGYMLEDRKSILDKVRDSLLFAIVPVPVLRHTQLLFNGSLGVKKPQHAADYSPSFNVAVNQESVKHSSITRQHYCSLFISFSFLHLCLSVSACLLLPGSWLVKFCFLRASACLNKRYNPPQYITPLSLSLAYSLLQCLIISMSVGSASQNFWHRYLRI
jgi:hypothetical protein